MRNYLYRFCAVAAVAAVTASVTAQTATDLEPPKRADLLYDFDGDGRWEVVKKLTFYERGNAELGLTYSNQNFYMAQTWDDATFRIVDGVCYARIPSGSGLEADLTLDGEELVRVDTQDVLDAVTRGRLPDYRMMGGKVCIRWGHDAENAKGLGLLVLVDLQGNFLRPLAKVDYNYNDDYTATDFTGDGRMDLVAAVDGRCTLLAQTAAGDFATVFTLPGDMPRLPVRFDANGDGRPDFYVYDGEHRLLLQQADGSWLYSDLPVTTDSTAVGAAPLSNAFSSPWQDGTNMSGAALADENYGAAAAFGNLRLAMDLNGDGYEDLVDTEAGGVMLSVGDGRFYPADFGGRVAARDLNGDGATDFLVFNPETEEVSARLSSPAGFEERTLLTNGRITGVYCQDLNGDGAADVLLTLNGQDIMDYSFLVFLVNDGKGSFRTVEKFFTEKYRFTGCHWLGDGWGVTARPDYSSASAGTLISWDSSFNLLHTALPKSGGEENDFFTDLDGDGVLEGIAVNAGTVLRYADHTPGTAPSVPGTPSLHADGANGRLRVEWTAPAADGARAANYTYRYRVERADGTHYAGEASADGAAAPFATTAPRYERALWLRTAGWPEGDYQVRVQAVDAMGRAGEWSASTTYTHLGQSVGLELDRVWLATGDTLRAVASDRQAGNPAYAWSVEGGHVVSQDGGSACIVFSKHGRRQVTVSALDAEGQTKASATREVEVTAYRPGKINYNAQRVTDLNGDGRPEAYRNGIFTSDGRGNYTRLPSLFNADVNYVGGTVIDLNLDGYPDLAGGINKNGTYYSAAYGSGDLNFTLSSTTPMVDLGDGQWTEYSDWANVFTGTNVLLDADNDGHPDFYNGDYPDYGLFRWVGDQRWARCDFPDPDFRAYAASDYDRDGWVDLYGEDAEGACIYRNLGNLRFERVALPDLGSLNYLEFADLDGDGALDAVTAPYGNKYLQAAYAADGFQPSDRWDITWLRPIGLDIDGDGRMELADREHNLYYLQADGSLRAEPYAAGRLPHPFSSTTLTSDQPATLADMSGDGRPDYNGTPLLSGIANTPPSTPQNVAAVTTPQGVLLTWDAATDAESRSSALLYNVSLKRSGAEGEGAYILSPMTCGREEARPTESYWRYFREATRMTVPLGRFEAGATYELSVQAVDPWGARSPFSAVYTFRAEAAADIDLPAETGEGVKTTVRYAGNLSGTPAWDWDGGRPTADGDAWTVVWDEPGIKTVRCTVGQTVLERTVRVVAKPDLEIELPWKVAAGSTLTAALPSVFQTAPERVSLTVPEALAGEVDERGATVTLHIPETGSGGFNLGVTYQDDIFKTPLMNRNGFTVGGYGFRPEIGLVTADPESGRNLITWTFSIPDADRDLFDSIYIYKETGATDRFVRIGQTDVDAKSFVDATSTPEVCRSRYFLTVGTFLAGETAPSAVHASVHLMINKAAGGGYNLIWTPYEGGTVTQYTLLRGPSPEALVPFARLSGHEMSFTDTEPGEGPVYYGLSYDALQGATPYAADGDSKGRANVVCSTDAGSVTPVESIEIQAAEGGLELNEARPELQLVALVAPVRATFRQVNWTIEEGGTLAAVGADGLLRLLPGSKGGAVTVRATAIDGSGATAVATVKAGPLTGIGHISADGTRLRLDAAGGLCVENVRRPVTVRVYAADGRLLLAEPFRTDGRIAPGRLPAGAGIATADGAVLKFSRP